MIATQKSSLLMIARQKSPMANDLLLKEPLLMIGSQKSPLLMIASQKSSLLMIASQKSPLLTIAFKTSPLPTPLSPILAPMSPMIMPEATQIQFMVGLLREYFFNRILFWGSISITGSCAEGVFPLLDLIFPLFTKIPLFVFCLFCVRSKFKQKTTSQGNIENST